VQAAAVVAWDDDAHVLEQRARYHDRLALLSAALGAAGLPAPLPAGGFYLWVPVPDIVEGRRPGAAGGWAVAEALALRAGLLVSPGEFYGPAGSGFVRVAVVQPRERLELVAGRLAGTDITADTAAHPAPTP
jgi:aspartate/methionine/tyrosine aminotransferase